MTASPRTESERLLSLEHLQVLDTPPESAFDGLVRAAALACRVPISQLSLVDAERQWFKASVGMHGVTQTPREVSFCSHAIVDDGVFEVPDMLEDPRFAENPLVTGFDHVRFYAGAVLRLRDGSHVGTLCVIDREPGLLTQEQREMLTCLSTAAVQLLETRRTALDLAGSEARFRSLGESSPLGVFAATADGTCTFTNERWRTIFDASGNDAPGSGWREALHPDDRATLFARWRLSAASNLDFDREFRVRHGDGTVLHARMVSCPLLDDDGIVTGHVGSVEDVTDRVRQREALEHANEKLRVTLQSIGDAVITTDAEGRVTWLNPAAERMTDWFSDEAAGCALRDVFHIVDGDSRRTADDFIERCVAKGERVGSTEHTVLVLRDGTERSVQHSAAPILDRTGTLFGAVLVLHDVTEQRRLSSEMAYRAEHDELTGLVNRSEFERRLRRRLERAREDKSENALFYIDLDEFKVVNDACGHAAGDRLLTEVARLLGETVRGSDTLARLGGDEFGVILERCTGVQALRAAQQICDRMETFRFMHDGRPFRIGTSIGLVPLDGRWDDASAIMQAADMSCYAAKEAGRNRVHAWFDTDKAMQGRRGDMRWATRLTQALDEDRFVLHAQRLEPLAPDEADGICVEMLIRLSEPDGRLIMPNAFLPAAERFHLVTRIDRWVLQSTVERLGAASAHTDVALVCINFSGRSIGDRVFRQDAVALLEAAGDDVCRRLCFEVTETAAVTNLSDAMVFIERVRALGVRVALDDFGAGASSFGYLRSLPVDTLKIDGHFIQSMIDDPLSESAVRCFVDVARVMGLKTVAEFVDRPETLERVRELGIDYAQGFLLHRPEPADELMPRHALPMSMP